MEKRNVEYDLVWWLLGMTRIDLEYIIVNTKYNVTTIFGSRVRLGIDRMVGWVLILLQLH